MKRFAATVLLALAVSTCSSSVTILPTGAAVVGVTCSKFSGILKFTPPLGPAPKAQYVSFTNAKLSGCSGSQGVSGILSYKSKPVANQSCHDLRHLALFMTGPETIKWANGHTSTLKSVQYGSPGPLIFNGTVTTGALKGLKQKTVLTYKVPAGIKSLCGLKALTHSLQGKVKFVIK